VQCEASNQATVAAKKMIKLLQACNINYFHLSALTKHQRASFVSNGAVMPAEILLQAFSTYASGENTGKVHFRS
jgi:hypothetical protein